MYIYYTSSCFPCLSAIQSTFIVSDCPGLIIPVAGAIVNRPITKRWLPPPITSYL